MLISDENFSIWQLSCDNITDKLLPDCLIALLNAGCRRFNGQADGTQSPNVNESRSGLLSNSMKINETKRNNLNNCTLK